MDFKTIYNNLHHFQLTNSNNSLSNFLFFIDLILKYYCLLNIGLCNPYLKAQIIFNQNFLYFIQPFKFSHLKKDNID